MVINKVPPGQVKRVKEEAAEKYGAAGIKVLGVIPENRVLLAITIGELAEVIKGKILNIPKKPGSWWKTTCWGRWWWTPGWTTSGARKIKPPSSGRSGWICSWRRWKHRPECLVLSGGADKPPAYGVLHKAESQGIPIITTGAAVSDIVTSIDNA